MIILQVAEAAHPKKNHCLLQSVSAVLQAKVDVRREAWGMLAYPKNPRKEPSKGEPVWIAGSKHLGPQNDATFFEGSGFLG